MYDLNGPDLEGYLHVKLYSNVQMLINYSIHDLNFLIV